MQAKIKEETMGSFATSVIKKMNDLGIDPTPLNYSAFFERELSEKNKPFRDKITNILEDEKEGAALGCHAHEKSLSVGFSSIKHVLHFSANIYRNTAAFQNMLKRNKIAISSASGKEEIKSTISFLEHDLDKFITVMDSSSQHIKVAYDNAVSAIKVVQETSVFNGKMGVHNIKYFISRVDAKRETANSNNHKSVILAVTLSKKSIETAEEDKTLTVAVQTLLKMLSKIIHKTDIIAYHKEGICLVLLKHTDITRAKILSERLYDLSSNSQLFLNNKELEMTTAIGIKEIVHEVGANKLITLALDAMTAAQNSPRLAFVISEGQETEKE
jgi:GGDEF domain-containing protein